MSVDKFCEKWATGIASGEGVPYKRWKSVNVFYDGRTIYSYGNHFPMAYIIAPNLVWLNGDRFSNTTSRHQSALRSAIRLYAPEATVVIVPQQALDAARIDYRTIQPVEIQSERWEFTKQSSVTPPRDMSTVLTEIRTEWEQGAEKVKRERPIMARYGSGTWNDDASTYDDTVGIVVRDGSRQLVRYFDGQHHWHTARHWLGDCVFTAEREMFTRERGSYRERSYFISSFDKQERTPLYFLSQLPAPADTVDQAIELLAPESVHTARSLGRHVVRQGDMFAIPMDVTTRQLGKLGAKFERRKVTVELRSHAKESIAVRKGLEVVRENMPAYPVRVYFDYSKHTREGFDAIYKQYTEDCDKWADLLIAKFSAEYPNLPAPSRWSWQSAINYKTRVWDRMRTVTGSALYGTAHTATEVATLPDGRQYARGVMYHEPAIIGDRRNADHARQTLGKQWHLITRNTVPVSGVGRR